MVPGPDERIGGRYVRQPRIPRTRALRPRCCQPIARGSRQRTWPARAGLVATGLPGAVGATIPRHVDAGGPTVLIRLVLAIPIVLMPNLLYLSVDSGVPGLNAATPLLIM